MKDASVRVVIFFEVVVQPLGVIMGHGTVPCGYTGTRRVFSREEDIFDRNWEQDYKQVN